MTILLGANDSVDPTSSQHVPLNEYTDNITQIINHIRRINSRVKIILITPPRVDSNQWPTRAESVVSLYADAIRLLSIDLGTHLIDTWGGISAEPVHCPLDNEGNVCDIRLDDLRDGLHLGVEGNKKLANCIMKLIRNELPHLCPDTSHAPISLSWQCPLWTNMAEL